MINSQLIKRLYWKSNVSAKVWKQLKKFLKPISFSFCLFVMVLFTVEYLRAESENGNLQREIGDSRREI